MIRYINIADLVNPDTGKTYRQENAELTHKIPIGSLVELETGVRLFVVDHYRDCDMTPLYCLCAEMKNGYTDEFYAKMKWHCGYPEESLRRVTTAVRPSGNSTLPQNATRTPKNGINCPSELPDGRENTEGDNK